MRILLSLFALSSVLSAYEFDLKPQHISPEVTCFFGEPEAMNLKNNGNMVNTCYIDTKESYVVIDSGSSYAYAESAYNTMQRIKPLKVSTVINTHIHDDHWLGNGFYAQKGAIVLGSVDFVSNVIINSPTRIQTYISPEAYKGTVPMLPTKTIDSDMNMTVGNQTVELRLMKQKAHTEKDLVVFLPKSKTLFAGDLVFNDRVPSLIGGNINGWIQSLEDLKQYGPTAIIGGHGYRTDKDALVMTHNYLTQMRSEIRSAIEAGLGIQDTIEKVKMPEYRSLRMYNTLHRGNVEASYRVLEWE